MKRIYSIKLVLMFVVLAGAFLLNSDTAFAQANIVIVNMDGPNEGFNDPTPRAPVGGNPGTTLGQQRLNAFQHAANIWGSKLNSNVTIYVQAFFNPQTCTATAAVLGSAGAIQIFADFPGRELNNTWYHVALANKLASTDLAPGPNGSIADDIQAVFNSNLNGNPACLGGRQFYLGFDNNHGTNIDLVTVVLHEIGHGLGFANFVNEASGTRPLDLGDIFSQYTRDMSTNKIWNAMTNAERAASAINTNKVVWDGINVNGAASGPVFGTGVLNPGVPSLKVTSPAALGSFRIGTSSVGPALTSPGISAGVVQALDGVGNTNDGCTALTNAAAVAGNIALVDLSASCSISTQTLNAQNAGAAAVIIVDSVVRTPPPGIGGTNPAVLIPLAVLPLADGNAIRTALLSGPVNGTLGIDTSVLAGTDFVAGKVLLNAPNPLAPGSSISHFDPIASPNQLMEPNINANLTHSIMEPEDLTLKQMVDIGWFSDGDGVPDGVDECIGSSPSPTVVIDGCDSGVPNTVFPNGCRISDRISQIAASSTNHDEFVSRVANFLNELVSQGVITGRQKGAIQSCAAKASIP